VIRRASRPIRGQALVECAIALNVLLLLTLCVLDAGRAIWEYNTVAYLARDGARYGTIPSYSSTDIQNHVRSGCTTMLSNPCPVAPTFAVSVTRGTCGSTVAPVIVTVTDRFQPVTPLLAHLWGSGPLPLTATSQMFVQPGPPGGCAS
jgi:Flp pilus assembly protein TadG